MTRHPDALTRREVTIRTIEMLTAFGLDDWTVRISDRMTRTYGVCEYGPRRITLSGPLVDANPAEHTIDTIAHEVAHALAGMGAAHGPKWKAACKRTGATPRACYEASKVEPAAASRWAGHCPACGTTVAYRVRTPDLTRQTYHQPSKCPAGRHTTHADRRIVWRDRHDPHYVTAAQAPTTQESIMAGKYTVTLTYTDGTVTVTERARRDDAVKAAERARHDTIPATPGLRLAAYEVATPTGEVTEAWKADDVTVDVPVAAQTETVTYRRPRIPAGATVYECDGCARTLPVTKFPTTQDRSRATECRECRDARRAASV